MNASDLSNWCYGEKKVATSEEFMFEIKEFRCGFVRGLGSKMWMQTFFFIELKEPFDFLIENMFKLVEICLD